MNILCYKRPWADRYYTDLAQAAFPDADRITYIGDFLGLGDGRLQERFYDHYRRQAGRPNWDMDGVTFEDVRIRCRLLRNIPASRAEALCSAMWAALTDIVDEVRPDVVVSKTVDSYVIDLLSILCRRKGVDFVGLVAPFINNAFRITTRGEHRICRRPDEEEVRACLDNMLRKDYQPDWLDRPDGPSTVARKALVNQLKDRARTPYFYLKRKTSGDPLNYHYWSSQIVPTLRGAVIPRLYMGDSNWRAAVQASGSRPAVFIPLQCVPEGTIDYWCPNVDYIDYKRTLLRIVDTATEQGFRVLIKEHPGVVGLREYSLYRALARHADVIMVPPQVRASELLAYCTTVLVWTGTVGFEAALRGVPVIHLGYPFYVSGRLFYGVESMDRLSDVMEDVRAAMPGISGEEQADMIRHVLSGVLPGELRETDWNGLPGDRDGYDEQVRRVAAGIRRYVSEQPKGAQQTYTDESIR